MGNVKQLQVKIQQRYEDKDLWYRINPILAKGEVGIEKDTGHFKYGDGKTKWRELEYAFGNGVVRTIFEGFDNERDGSYHEVAGDLSNPDKVFRMSTYSAEEHPGEIILVPRCYTITTTENGQEKTENFTMDTPYISLRKNSVWMWTLFSDEKDKPLVTSQLDQFVLDVSPLG